MFVVQLWVPHSLVLDGIRTSCVIRGFLDTGCTPPDDRRPEWTHSADIVQHESTSKYHHELGLPRLTA